jgi:hypothetical protein
LKSIMFEIGKKLYSAILGKEEPAPQPEFTRPKRLFDYDTQMQM